MGSNQLTIKIVQDKQRQIECFIFSEFDTIETTDFDSLVQAHHDVLDMFLCPQPLIVVKKANKNDGGLSQNAHFVKLEHLQPPYDTFLVNIHALDIIEGKKITDKLSLLAEFSNTEEERLFLIDALLPLEEKGLYLVCSKDENL